MSEKPTWLYVQELDDPIAPGVSSVYCRYRTSSDSWHWRQCTRKPVEEIDGYGLCKQHYKMVRAQARADNADGHYTDFIA
jgi:hypothetical protein